MTKQTEYKITIVETREFEVYVKADNIQVAEYLVLNDFENDVIPENDKRELNTDYDAQVTKSQIVK